MADNDKNSPMMKMSAIDKISFIMQRAIESSGRTPTLMGNPLAASAAAAPDGGLPIFLIYAQKVNDFLTGKESEDFLNSVVAVKKNGSLTGTAVQCNAGADTALFPVISLFYQSLAVAMEMSDDPDHFELANLLQQPLKSEVFDELSIPSGPEIYSTQGSQQHAPGQ
jgi:hypothetical protein